MASFPIVTHDVLVGTTLRCTWVSSGNTPSQISSAMRDRDDVVINSLAAVSSGNGFYYAPHTLPNSPGWYVNEWRAWVNSFEYISRQLVRARTMETD